MLGVAINKIFWIKKEKFKMRCRWVNVGACAPISRRRDRFHTKIRFAVHGKKPGRDVRQADGWLNMNLGEHSGW